MVQRHPHDDVVTLPNPHADKSSPMFVPIELRDAFDAIDAATEERMRHQLYSEITEPWMRTVNGRPVTVNHRSNAGDFATALCWLKIAEAAHRVARDTDRRASQEQSRRNHTCALCGRVDPTANSAGLTRTWCQNCRGELHRQEVEAHAATKVGDRTVAELVAAARQKATP